MANLAAIRDMHPGWRIWRGHLTKSYWACPPRRLRELGLLEGRTVAELDAKITSAEKPQRD